MPLVPAMCIGFSLSNSEGYSRGLVVTVQAGLAGTAHLIANLATPLEHLWYRLLIHAPARLANGIDNGKVGLQRIQGRDGSLRPSAPCRLTHTHTLARTA